jgi:hypothetical protein
MTTTENSTEKLLKIIYLLHLRMYKKNLQITFIQS